MEEVSSGLKAINDLLTYEFFIPDYQRGYRWEKDQVRDLLNDVFEFYNKDEKPKSEFYCLQPIVVSKNPENGKMNVIDGQQRLTTIHLIMTCLNSQREMLRKGKYSIEYATRPMSESFLNKIEPERREDNVDFYYMAQAYDTINDWFNEHEGEIAVQFMSTLLGSRDNNVRVIWYELPENAKPIEVFTRLNMGKIGLTNSELIKALFLSSSYKMNEEEKQEQPHRNKEIAAQWDSFEATLRDSSFWGFIQNGKEGYANHIEFLFDLLADNISKDGSKKDDDKYFTFRYFAERIKSVEDAWNEWEKVKEVFQLLHDWHTDNRFYHLIGYLISTGTSINYLRANAEDITKSELFEFVRDRIKETVPENIELLNYQDNRHELKNALLLFNVLSILNNPESNSRFQFGRYKGYKDHRGWDIEHIHSVKSEMPKARAHQSDWLKEVLNFTHDQEVEELVRDYMDTPVNDRPEFSEIYDTIVERYSDADDTDSDVNDISNLALLDSGTNRGYKNAVFPIKRKIIIEKDQTGTFIPLCTKNVFLKYYNKQIEQTTFWGKQDRETYKKALTETISEYLNGKVYE